MPAKYSFFRRYNLPGYHRLQSARASNCILYGLADKTYFRPHYSSHLCAPVQNDPRPAHLPLPAVPIIRLYNWLNPSPKVIVNQVNIKQLKNGTDTAKYIKSVVRIVYPNLITCRIKILFAFPKMDNPVIYFVFNTAA